MDKKDEKDMRQNILLVDGNSILPNNLVLIITGVRDRFRNAKISVLTFKDKEAFIRENFPGVEVIVPKNKLKNPQLAFQMFYLLRKKFDFIVLSSLSVSSVAVGLIFGRCNIFLHNRWLEWYGIRFRAVGDIFLGVKSADSNRRKIDRGFNDALKSFGRYFVMLVNVREKDIRHSVLIEDNGYTDIGHVLTAVHRAEEIFMNPDITILTFKARGHYFVNMFPEMKVTTIEKGNRYALAMQMYRMRKFRFNSIVLTTLDASPVIMSLLFMRAKVLLYNRWHQWWSLNFRGLSGYFRKILSFLIAIPAFIYLLIASGFILLRMGFRFWLADLKTISRKENGRGCETF